PKDATGEVLEFTTNVLPSPTLQLTYPKTVFGEKATIEGSVDLKGKVMINGEEVPLTTDLQFDQEVDLQPGRNDFTVTAFNREGKSSTQTISIHYYVRNSMPEGNRVVYMNFD